MKQTFTLATVLVFFTLCSFGQKKEIMRNNLHSNNGVKTHADRHFSHSMNQVKPGDLHNDFLTVKAKTHKPSDFKSSQAFKHRLDSIVYFAATNVPDYKVYFTYDANGNNTQELDYEWDSNTSTWGAYKDDYTYDANGNLTQFLDSIWSSNTNTWVGYRKGTIIYDANGNLTQYFEYNWDSNTSAWVGSDKIDFTYDANGYNTQELDYKWDSNTNVWVASSKYDITYDANRNKTQEFRYNWDSNSNTWVDYSKSEYTSYDANGNYMQVAEYNWDSNTNAWVDGSKNKYDYTYDVNRNTTSIIYHQWDKTISQFIPYHKRVYTYDLLYTLSDLLFPPDWADGQGNKPLEDTSYDWDKVSSSWVNPYTDIYYYSDISITSVPKTVASGIDIYPNPVSDYIKVSGVTGVATFNLYNIQGKLILSKTVTSDEPVNVSGLSKGAYTYNIIVGRKQQAGKIIKK